MGKHFLRIKRRTRLNALISSLSIGVGTALAALSAVLILTKLGIIAEALLGYILCSVGAAVISLVLYLLFMPSDKRLARRLDREHSFDEKIRTMVQFKDSDDDFVRLQREDADSRLADVRIKTLASKQIISAIVVAAISVTALTGALLVPAKAEEEEQPISAYDKTELLAGLSELIVTVERSLMQDELKEYTVISLESLVTFVEEHSLFSEMKGEAVAVVVDLSGELAYVNSAGSIGEPLAESTDALISDLGEALTEYHAGDLRRAFRNVADSIEADKTDKDEFANKLELALSMSGVSRDDSLYNSFKVLISEIRGGGDIRSAFELAIMEAVTVISDQNINDKTMTNVLNKLCSLFEITEDDLVDSEGGSITDFKPSPPTSTVRPDDTDEDSADDDEKKGDGGGFGKGETLYRADDEIYDPVTESYVPYYELVGRYDSELKELYNDNRIPDDIADMIEDYYTWLMKPE